MEEFEVDGLVIREVKTGESDMVLTVLTSGLGRITVSGRGLASSRSKFYASVQQFSYSTLLLRKKGEYYYLKDAYYLQSFMGLRYDVEKLALATYVCDVACELSPADVADSDFLPLVLNTLYALSELDMPLCKIKAAFEFRAMVQAGFMPDLDGCGVCGCDISDDCILDVMNGRILCKKCKDIIENDPEYIASGGAAKILIRLSPTTLAALRYIESAPQKRFLSFSIPDDELELLAVVCERYLLNHLERGFASLDYYKKIRVREF